MQRLEISGAVRDIYIYMSLGGKGLIRDLLHPMNLTGQVPYTGILPDQSCIPSF
jgi:hypothetical protein